MDCTGRFCSFQYPFWNKEFEHIHLIETLQMNVLGSEGMVDAVLQNLRACQDTDTPTRKRLLDAISYNTAINSCVQLKKVPWHLLNDLTVIAVVGLFLMFYYDIPSGYRTCH